MANPTSQKPPWDIVDEASAESFPASDPPGYGSFHASTDGGEFLERDSPARPHALIAFDSTQHPRMTWIAQQMAAALEQAGVMVDIADASAHAMPVPPDYELVIVGLTLKRLGDHTILRWVESVKEALSDVPSALFVVGAPRRKANRPINHLLRWDPVIVHVFPPSRRTDRYLSSIADFVHRVAVLVRANNRSSMRG